MSSQEIYFVPPGLQKLRVTFSIIFFVVAFLLAFVAWINRRRGRSAATFINIAAAVFALGAFEAYLAHQDAAGDGSYMQGTITDGFVHRDDLLGYAPAPSARVTARKLYGDSVLYDVVYTTDANGLRITAPASGSAKECVLFFGDSITFGEGVGDGENFPFLVSAKVADRYATYNFAYSGYGPHQMLANLQSGRVGRIVDCAPKYVFYLCIPDHAARVAGLYSWDEHGPRFVLRPNGSVIQRGHFDDGLQGPESWRADVEQVLSGSLIWQRLFSRLADEAKNIALLDAVIGESVQTAQGLFPGSVFEVILWDGGDNDQVRLIESGLKTRGVRVRLMTDIVPDFYANSGEYLLSPHDRHPNRVFHRKMADSIAEEVLDGRSAETGSRLDQ
jgi:hypothetical protein